MQLTLPNPAHCATSTVHYRTFILQDQVILSKDMASLKVLNITFYLFSHIMQQTVAS